MTLRNLLIGTSLAVCTTCATGWFPEQKAPATYRLLECTSPAETICAAALQGLAAKAVNQQKNDEQLVLAPVGADYSDWIARTEKRLNLKQNPSLSLEAAIVQYKPFIKGYVLYQPDLSAGDTSQFRDGINLSVNTATMLAGLLDALPVSPELEILLKKHGFVKLIDARELTFDEVTAANKSKLDRNVICSLDPRTANLRDLAVAHNLPVCFGNEEAMKAAAAADSPFAVLGWGTGDEFKHVAPFSKKGGFETVSNWAKNLSLLSAGAGEYQPKKIKPFDPRTIDWKDERRTVSVILSDGDNTGWVLGSFWKTPYYGSKLTGKFPAGFSVAMAQMAQMAPVVIDRLAETKPDNVSLIEFSGGYFYPDLFAEERPDRSDILREHARNLNEQMKKTGAHLVCFIVNDSASRQAKEAYRIFAEELEQLYGMLVMDYAPYHKGMGQIYWAANRDGIEIPAVTARFCLWSGMNRPNAGSPETVAESINTNSAANSWIATHAWSRFKQPDTGKEIGGTEAMSACINALNPKEVHAVTPEEMIWRIRMAHNPEQTKTFIEEHFK